MIVDFWVLHQFAHTCKVVVQVGTAAQGVEALADSSEQSAQTLRLWVIDVVEQLLYTFVHDTLPKHLHFEEFADEHDESKTLTFGL
jgi:hypothetical protein